MNYSKLIFIGFIILAFFGCEQRPDFSKKITIDKIWTYENELKFPFAITDTDSNYDLILSLTYGLEFDYQNLYVKIITIYPDGNQDEDIISLNLTDGSGLFLGDCGSKKCEIDLLLQERFKFKEAGSYEITIIQNGRVDKLEDIYGAELKLYKIREKT